MTDITKTEDAPTTSIPFDPLLASIFTAMSVDAATTTNRLLESHDAHILELQKAFVDFYNVVMAASEVVTTRKLEWALQKHGWRYEASLRAIEESEESY